MKGLSSKPMKLGALIRKLKRAEKMHGGNTMVGMALTGNNVVMPILDVQFNDRQQRVTVIANFSDSGQKHVEHLTCDP